MTARGRQPLTPAELLGRVVITVPEYAATFFADERTVRRDIKVGRLNALQVGDTWRILVAPLLRQCGLTDPGNSEGEPGSSPIATIGTTPDQIGRLQHAPRAG